jgi:tRNA threonylcarbamoyladenosine biosynthesis protein TsaE
MRRWVTRSPEETRALGRELAGELAPEGILLLEGGLAAGKTVLAQGVAAGLGIPANDVQSPTYTLVREHRGPDHDLIHLDLYRLGPEQAAALGLEEILSSPAVKVVEWADRLPFELEGAVRLRFERLGEQERAIEEW